MTLWIFIAIVAYLLLALNGVADKFLLTKAVGDPGVYAFYVSVTSLAVLILFPFGLHLLTPENYLIAAFGGMCFTFALYFFYSSIQKASISRILPIEGGLVPFFTLILAYITGIDTLNHTQLVAFALLVIGAVLIDFKKTRRGWEPLALRDTVLAGLLFALSFILTKYTFNQAGFVSGLIWSRLGLTVGAGVMLAIPSTRKGIFSAPRNTSNKNKLLFYSSHLAGSAGSFLQNYAIALGSVVIVNALQGVQFVFILLLSVTFSKFFPQIIKEDIHGKILVQKIIAIILITTGLVLLNI
ncbi:MAG TPA: EamA family transporter [Methylomirabilota bacterium]|nr:EamA family transporter [Methylomirabilota bacterium]